jgi:alpha-tubulin suppressor-like RCC1 family protein
MLAFIVPLKAEAQLVAAGPYHTIVVASDGTAWAWGLNAYGQLGDNSNTMRKTPVQVQNLTSVIAVAAGMYHSLALTSDGTVWAWGLNNTRQLGDGTTTNRSLPVSTLTGMVKIAAGDDHGLAIDTNGTLWVWGANGSGQLGTGNTTVPNSPVTLTTPTGMAAIAGGSNFSVAVKSDGTVWSWGSNANGQLGNGSTTPSTSPIQATGVTDATAVAAGTCHSLVLKSTGALVAAGCNNNGRLGDGTTTTPRTSYVSVIAISNVVSIAAADRHSAAVDSAGSVWTWGFNGSSQLGDGGTTSRSTPATISGIANATRIAAGGSHNVAVTSAGVVYGWGVNTYGQVGDGTVETRSTATAISDANFAWKAGTPILSPSGASSTYTNGITVTFTNATPNVTMRYSTDGTTPTEAHQLYSGPITVDATMELKVKAWHATLAASNVAVGVFTLKPVTPTVTPSGGTYTSAQTVSMSTSTVNATIRYTTDGSTPTATSPAYSSPVTVNSPTTIKAVAFRTGWTPSDVRTAAFSFSNYQPAVSYASPGAGTYHLVPVVVSFGTAEPNSDVRYSLTASATPTTLIPQPIELHKTTIVSHRVRIQQPNNTITYGPVTYTTYTVKVATPVIGLAAGQYDPGTVIQLTSATPNAIFRYRLDGQTPSESDPIVPSDGKLMVGNFTLTVRGFFKEMDPSDVATAVYTVSRAYSSGTMAGGGDHSVALRPDGVVLTWGSNTRRQLGYGERRQISGYTGDPYGEIVVNPQTTPQVAGITGVVAIAAGNSHTVALRADGTVLTWGNDNAIGTTKGVLGRAPCNLEYHSSSIRSCIQPDSVGLTDIVAIAAGYNHTLALKSNGTVWAWGNNASGQVGNGATTTQPTPVQVPGLSAIAEIAASRDHSLARRTDGTVYGWGDSFYAQIGDLGPPYLTTTPIEIEDFAGAISIGAGGYMAMARMADGTLRVRGRWGAGQLGNGETNPEPGHAASVPIGLGAVSTFMAGDSHVLATRPIGEILSWGYNSHGELGNPAWGNTTEPGLVPNVMPLRSVTAGSNHSLAIGVDGSGWLWGDNFSGQIGDNSTTDKTVPTKVFDDGTFNAFGGGGFLENVGSQHGRKKSDFKPPIQSSILSFVPPQKGAFTFPEPYNTTAARLTDSGDCGGSDCLWYVGYSYWRRMNYHVGRPSIYILLALKPGLAPGSGGSGPTIFSYNKNSGAVTKMPVPLFPESDPDFPERALLRLEDAEMWYFSADPVRPFVFYAFRKTDTKLRRFQFDVDPATGIQVGHAYGGEVAMDLAACPRNGGPFDCPADADYFDHPHSSDNDNVHVATVRRLADGRDLGCVVYEELLERFRFFAPETNHDLDECALDKEGRWLILNEIDRVAPTSYPDDQIVIDLHDVYATVYRRDEAGAHTAHADLGYGYSVGPDNVLPNHATTLVKFPVPVTQTHGELVHNNGNGTIDDANHVSHTNAVSWKPAELQYACGSNASQGDHRDEIVCFSRHAFQQNPPKVLVVAPVMTDQDSTTAGNGAAGAGPNNTPNQYARFPKGNLDVTGEYFIWTANLYGKENRLDAFIVRVPKDWLVQLPPPQP